MKTTKCKDKQPSFLHKALLLLSSLLLSIVTMQAQRFVIDGLRYNVNADGSNTVSVSADNKNISGDITIPSTITKADVTYTVTSISEYAFQSCSRLASVIIPENVTNIGGAAFWGCSSLISVSIPEGVTSIGESAFGYCSSLISVVIPEGVTSIGGAAFLGCSSLISVVIPEGVTSIGESAFGYCSSLTSVVIPEGVTSIGESAFSDCTSLTSISIPKGVTSIGESAFSVCTSLTSISIPKDVTSIGNGVFVACSSLTSVVIPEGVTSIGNNVFAGCSKLTSVSMPSSLTSIGEGAFHICISLVSVTIPGNVTYMGSDVFAGCTALRKVEARMIQPPSVFFHPFSLDLSKISLIIPKGTRAAYLAAGWIGFRTIDDSITSTASGVPPAYNTLRAFAANGLLQVSGLTAGERFYVYDLQGRQVYAGQAIATEHSVALSGSRGVYIVSTSRQSVKVIYSIIQ
jgi:hypothetical protein